MSPRFICILAPRYSATIRLLVCIITRLPGPRSHETQVGVNRLSFFLRHFLLFFPLTFLRGDISLFSSQFYPPFLLDQCSQGNSERQCARSMARITSRTRTLTAIDDLSFRDPYYLNAGALFAGWYRGDRNIPQYNEAQGQVPSNESNSRFRSISPGVFSKLVVSC